MTVVPLGVPWWAWVAIWGGLVLALLVMLALFAWWLFRKFVTLMGDLSDLAEASGVLAADGDDYIAPPIAVLADIRDIHAREQARKAHRLERRRLRHDRRMARARRITTLDATQREWPRDWYGS